MMTIEIDIHWTARFVAITVRPPNDQAQLRTNRVPMPANGYR
jgi:hypothetical protein